MSPDLPPIAAALAALTDDELRALHNAVENAPPMAPGLLAYLTHACDQEAARRDGHALRLREPREAIPHEELGQSFATIAALMVHFRMHPRLRLIEAVGDELVARPPETVHWVPVTGEANQQPDPWRCRRNRRYRPRAVRRCGAQSSGCRRTMAGLPLVDEMIQ